jgi:hypothetical protein
VYWVRRVKISVVENVEGGECGALSEERAISFGRY